MLAFLVIREKGTSHPPPIVTLVLFLVRVTNRQKKTSHKRLNTTPEETTDMAFQEALDKIHARFDCLASAEQLHALKLELKEEIKTEIKILTDTFVEKISRLEGRVFELEARVDKKDNEITSLLKKNDELLNAVKNQETKVKQNEKDMNDIQQYSRRWNVRVYRVPETERETMEDCVKKVCRIFTQDVGVATSPSDIEVAHRTGQRSGQRNRPILVRFFDRKKRDNIMANKKKLKNKGVVVGEDLTAANYKLYTAAYKHSASLSTWTVNGKVFAKLKNGLTVNLTIHTNIDEAFRRAMNSNRMSDTE